MPPLYLYISFCIDMSLFRYSSGAGYPTTESYIAMSSTFEDNSLTIGVATPLVQRSILVVESVTPLLQR